MRRIVLTAALTIIAGLSAFAQSPAELTKPVVSGQPRIGILLLAHGGSLAWNEEVRHTADRTDLSIPTEVALGMATRSTMQSAIDRLVARRVTEIVAVPLFVSSHSSVVDSIAYLLGLRTQMPKDLKEFAAMDHGSMTDHGGMGHMDASPDALKRVASPIPIRMAPALDAHRIVADILVDRTASVSREPGHEVVLLVAHGPVPDDDNQLWLHDMQSLADQIYSKTRYHAIDSITLRDDADPPVRNAATEQLRQKVKQVTDSGNAALIVPLLLSYGGIEDGLRKRLDGLTYRMPSQALLPDKRMVDWVIEVAKSTSQTNP